MQSSRGNRLGNNFTVRITEQQRADLASVQARRPGPPALGPYLVWHALHGEDGDRVGTARSGGAPAATAAAAVPQLGQCLDGGDRGHDRHCLQCSSPCAADGQCQDLGRAVPPPAERIILDLCGGSGAWSEPYRQAGYDVRTVTLPRQDVRDYVPCDGAWGVLAAPPCQEFSLAKNGQRRHMRHALSIVDACLRVVLLARPRWWALENPGGSLLSRWLGRPKDRWQPWQFGDAWTKLTAVWGEFALPGRGPFVRPTGSAMDRGSAAARALTPPGFAAAFFAANP